MQEEVKLPYVPAGLENDFSHFSRAMAHPARVTILLEMMKSQGVVEGRVVEVPGMSPSTVIQHLREMKKSSIIDGRIFGMRSKYWITKDSVVFFQNTSREFFSRFETLT
jgi:predicted transcriptional regulator